MQPDLEQLLQIIHLVVRDNALHFTNVILASAEGEVSFIEVTEGTDFRSELAEAVGRGMLALGLLGWEVEDKMIQAKSYLFPWHQDEEPLCALFKRLCEEGVASVKKEFGRHSVN